MDKIFNTKLVLAISIVLAAMVLGNSITTFKKLDRSVVVKGLSERQYEADIVIWPVGFSETANDLVSLYASLEQKKLIITNFLISKGIELDQISVSAPKVTDKQALIYSENKGEFRFIAQQFITIRSENITQINNLMTEIAQLGKHAIAFLENNYDNPIQYTFTKLNEIKPSMIEESTKEARAVAEKFANDSKSRLGKIKNASQGQFTITERDRNNPHIKVVRVVSTIEYYLSD